MNLLRHLGKRLHCWLTYRHRAPAGYCRCGLAYTYAYAKDDGL